MRILSWNINGFTKTNLPVIQAIVSSSKYDVVLFQETKSVSVPLPLISSNFKTVLFPSKKPNASGHSKVTRVGGQEFRTGTPR